jgi:hypothetical protein
MNTLGIFSSKGCLNLTVIYRSNFVISYVNIPIYRRFDALEWKGYIYFSVHLQFLESIKHSLHFKSHLSHS